MYKGRIEGNRVEYLELCSAYATFMESRSPDSLDRVVSLASTFDFGLDSDYQQDKATPFWGESPQPGPTYFFSKETSYVHIAVAHACGDSDGPTRFDRAYFYVRKKQCASSKDCNDTVFTLFDLLAAPLQPTCEQPPVFRTGYDAKGVVLEAAPATETEEREAARAGWAQPPPAAETAAEEATPSELTATALGNLIRRSSWHRAALSSACGVSLLSACEAMVQAVHRVAAGRMAPGVVRDKAVEAGELAIATRPGPAVTVPPPSELVDSIVTTQTMVRATLAYMLASRPQLIVREINHQMDRCSGTNISQFTFGGFATALSCDAADLWRINTMVSGHTKFAPDIAANKVANKYNSSDCWNMAHLLQHASLYATAVAYDETLLVDLHVDKHSTLFTQVPQVTKVGPSS